jgi:hypothetical protein
MVAMTCARVIATRGTMYNLFRALLMGHRRLQVWD